MEKIFISACFLLLSASVLCGQKYVMFRSWISVEYLDAGADNKVYRHEFNGGDFQKWTLEDVGFGYVKLVHKATGLVLDGDGKKVYLQAWNGGDFQMWKIEKTSDGYVKIIHKASDKVLTNPKNYYNEDLELYNNNTPGGEEFKYSKWKMESFIDPRRWITDGVSKDVKISQLSIPGTHDSGTGSECLSSVFVCEYGQCQDKTIHEQLNAGIRFLDIRLERVKNDLKVFHGIVEYDLTFETIMTVCRNFLKENPGEFILMSVKAENKGFDNKFWSDNYEKDPIFYRGCNYPTVEQAKGKIVLLRRFGEDVMNGFAINIADNTELQEAPTGNCSKSARFMVQDNYELKETQNDKKQSAVSIFMNAAKEKIANTDNVLALNFISHTAKDNIGLPSAQNAAVAMNPWLVLKLDQIVKGKYGVFIMDFPGEGLINAIISLN